MAKYVRSPIGEELPPITLPSTNPVANTYTMFKQAFTEPNRVTLLVPPKEEAGETKVTADTVVLDPAFYLALKAMIWIIVGFAAVNLILALVYPDPSRFQEHTFDAIESGWKVALGALVGLVVGKQS